MKVINRSDGNVVYSLPEFNIRRVFTPGESKDVPEQELNALFQSDGGAELIKHELLVQDEDWVKKTMPNAPIEYFWGLEEVKHCLLNESLDLFEETFDYAPQGVIDLIKRMAWQLPITDLNKMKVIQEKTGFDVLQAIEIMKKPATAQCTQPHERLRKREG